MNNLIFFKETFIKDFKIAFSYRLQFYISLFSIIFSFFFLVIFSSLVGDGNEDILKNYKVDYFNFLFLGILIAEITNTLLNTMPNTIKNYQSTGILEELMLNGRRESTIILSSLAFPSFRLIIRMMVYIILFGFFSEENIFVNLEALSLIYLLIFATSLVGISLIGSSLTIVLKGSSLIPQAYLLISSVLCGIAFPIELLPDFFIYFSDLLPTTHFLLLIRSDIVDGDFVDFNYRFSMLCIQSLILIILGTICLNRAIKFSKKHGTLLFY